MPSNKKPRKQQVKRKQTLPIVFRHSAEADINLQLAPHAELLKMREGYGDEGSWHTLTCRLNIGVTAGAQNRLEHEAIKRGLDAMINVRERFKKTGKFGLSGNDLKDIGDGLIATDELQLSLTRRQFNEAVKYVYQHAAK